MVYKHILDVSPVLACMTSGSFAESVTKEIVLPDDDVDCFGRLLEHLYGKDDAAFDFDLSADKEGPETMATVYELAEKYQLSNLKNHIQKMLGSKSFAPLDFFHCTYEISQKISDSDDTFDSFFKKIAPSRLQLLDGSGFSKLADLCGTGGEFAALIVELQGQLLLKMLADQKAYTPDTLRVQEDLEKLRSLHARRHSNCSKCIPHGY